MKSVLFAIAIAAATPAFAHSGLHVHPHADDPSWLVLLMSGLAVAGAAIVAWTRLK